MSKKNTNVMACGSAVITMTDGQVTTSVDRLANALHCIFARSHSRNTYNHVAANRA